MNAIDKFRSRAADVNSLLCVGLDSDAAKMPPRFHGDVVAFNRWIIDQTHPFVCAYKPNFAYYEARGVPGWRELQATIEYLREQHPHILTIADAKRGDIGSTNEQYAAAIFDQLGFDAITLHPFLGREALAPFLARADKACIVLCRTSNDGAGELQDLNVNGRPLWVVVADRVSKSWNANHNCMLVVGATYPDELRIVRGLIGAMPILMPGIGAQGGDVEAAVRAGVDGDGGALIVNASRSIIYADDPESAAQILRDDINSARG